MKVLDKLLKKWIALMLTLAMAASLTACAKTEPEIPEIPVEPEDTSEPQDPDDEDEGGFSPVDSLFTICFNDGWSFNPFKGTNRYNDQLFSLMYEGLFALDKDLEAYPVLCDTWSTADGTVYTVRIKSGVKLHSGKDLTAADVVYSLNTAKASSKFSERLSDIDYVESTGALTLEIGLKRTNYQLPKLLDTPIVAAGSGADEAPTGTGPFRLYTGHLTAYKQYRDYDKLEIKTIYLKHVDEKSLSEEFSGRGIDIICYDPTGLGTLNVQLVHETRRYETTDFLYLGFNNVYGATANADFRRAVSYAVDVDTICGDFFSGSVRKSPLVLSSALDVYDPAWESGTEFSRITASEMLEAMGMADDDDDGSLEYSDGKNFHLRFIVNSENPRKVKAAKRIARDMVNIGIDVRLEVLDWDTYLEALSGGDFSMYLGEAQLRADMDMSSILVPGGKLNYGSVTDTQYKELINAYLGAAEDAQRGSAAKALCEYVRDQAPIVPIAYKQFVTISHTGVISDAEPSQSGLFCGFADWTINME